MTILIRSTLIVAALCISACGGGNVKDSFVCANQDWSAFGAQTAQEGREVRTIQKYKEQCGLSEQMVEQYLDGYARALVTICTYDNGYDQGFNNNDFMDVCPYEIREQYVNGYKAGQLDYTISVDNVNRVNEENERREARLRVEQSGAGGSTGPTSPR